METAKSSLIHEPLYSKNSPFLGKVKESYLLNKEGSTKRTYHVVLDLSGSSIAFSPGDAIGIFPQNSQEEIEEIITLLGAQGDERVIPKRKEVELSFYDFLLKEANLSRTPSSIDPEKQDLPLLDFLRQKKGSFSPQEIAETLSPMLPRFYSIASSSQLYKEEVHLLVATFSRKVGEREIPGLGSHFLTHLAKPNETPVPLFVQRNETFSLPEDPSRPIIMIGPGTGLAPYRAFLQERALTPSKNWLFFGERHSLFDYYYQDELLKYEKEGILKLTTAFSRDDETKVYVQHRMWEQKEELLKWLDEGAILYVCGDAKRMSRDVTATLDQILEGRPETTKSLRKEGRLLLDVY